MTAEHTLWSQIRELRQERDELRFERVCLWCLVGLLFLTWTVHWIIVHGVHS